MHCPHCHTEIDIHGIKQLIREELAHLDPDTANRLIDQLAMRLGRSLRLGQAYHSYEMKSAGEEVDQDEY